jgi:hypothetical protein
MVGHFVAHISHHHSCSNRDGARRQDAERRSAQEARRQAEIVKQRADWQRKIDGLLQRANAVSQGPRPLGFQFSMK